MLNERSSGILLHLTSLFSPFGIGDMGPSAYRFVDFLSETDQRYWQVLPLNPTDQGSGNSPYSSPSAFAGNTLLISPEHLVESGLLSEGDLADIPPFPPDRCDFSAVTSYKTKLLRRAYERFKSSSDRRAAYERFCLDSRDWIDDFALFSIIKRLHGEMAWSDWDRGLRDRESAELANIKAVYSDALEEVKFFQYLFFRQWHDLKAYCNEKGVRIIGDIPIYVNYDSADVWTHPDIFKLDEQKRPITVAGVPPDYFSKTGQLWGNPIYRWDLLRKSGYRWWVERISHNLGLFDVMRLDHFRGFIGYWEVPYGDETAVNGQWVKGPSADFFKGIFGEFGDIPLIAEDLGVITADVRRVMGRFHLPGMRILLFGFDSESSSHPYLPHNYTHHCVVYTGTHDNNTIRGWFEQDATVQERERLVHYLGREVPVECLHKELIRLAMMSVADTVIIPMQDLLGLGYDARMNRPSTTHGNWEWRLLPDQPAGDAADFLRDITKTYGRSRQ